MKAYRAAVLRFDPTLPPDACAVYESDGLLVVGPDAQGRQVVQVVGPYLELHKRGWRITHSQRKIGSQPSNTVRKPLHFS